MNTIIRLMLVSLISILAAPVYADSVSHFLKCEQDDDASNEDLVATASKWLHAAQKQKGGDQLQIELHFPVVASMGETDFSFVIIAPSVESWAKFMAGYEGSPASKLDSEWDELAACPDSALFRSVTIK